MARTPSIGIVAASMAFLAMQAAPLEAAGERGKVQPIASATVNIRVSVAPRYQLRSALPQPEHGSAAAGSRQFCLSSNAVPGLLPVRLLRFGGSSTGPAETALARDEVATAIIAPCLLRDRHSKVGAALPGWLQGIQVVLIQPE